ncbi:Ger(x)C family spore germination protein [Clostridium swellfunianum]|uniref:Ger(x)C family spore germination protein n=1 Tax=Clostridium swellfunianum TaxID=1367462 RepID=UPI00202F3B7B|nr:Ger(x)C family spore germination protein [Clostridium swellfunianum]MCM0650968.1 Ger(x)C family spore germination protein [Clostridium swellfunianum]
MKLKKISLYMALILCFPMLAGCWDKTELEDIGYVAAIGIDKGAERNVRITFQITNPKVIGGGRSGGGQNDTKAEVIALEAPSLATARDLLTVTATRRISLAHAKVIVVGEKFARDESFFRHIESSLRDKEMRRIMTLIVSKETAEEFIKNNDPLLEDRMQKYYEFMSRRWKDTGYVPPFANLNRFMERTEVGQSLFLAVYASSKERTPRRGADEGAYLPGQLDRAGGSPAELVGSAVFKNGKMIGVLDGNETRLVSMMRQEPETKSFVTSFVDPLDNKYRIDTRIFRLKRSKIELDIQGDNTTIYVNVPLTMDVVGIPSFINYAEDKEKQKFLEDYLEKYMAKISVRLIEKTQQEFGGDPFQWELAARRKFFTQEEYKKYSWAKHYPEAKVNISYDITISSFGKQLNPPEDPSKMEKEIDKGQKMEEKGE